MTVSSRALKLLRRRRKRKKIVKKISPIIPYFFTFANALCGFLATVKAMDDAFVVAAYCIIIAAIMDAFDGRVARLCKSESLLGAELDGLCDAISFCFAPIMLVYSFYGAALGKIGLWILGLFVCAGLFRLARFNIHHGSAKSYFVGLPAPIAALFITLCILYQNWLLATPFRYLVHPKGIVVVVAVMGFLMISKVLYPSFKTYRFSLPYSLVHVVPLALIMIFCCVKQYPILFVICFGYILTGCAYYCLQYARRFLISVFYNL